MEGQRKAWIQEPRRQGRQLSVEDVMGMYSGEICRGLFLGVPDQQCERLLCLSLLTRPRNPSAEFCWKGGRGEKAKKRKRKKRERERKGYLCGREEKGRDEEKVLAGHKIPIGSYNQSTDIQMRERKGYYPAKGSWRTVQKNHLIFASLW